MNLNHFGLHFGIPFRYAFPFLSFATIYIVYNVSRQMDIMDLIRTPEIDKPRSSQPESESCKIPELDPWDADMKPFMKNYSRTDCPRWANDIGKRVFTQERGARILRQVVDLPRTKCCYIAIDVKKQRTRGTCFKIASTVTKIPENMNHILVRCKGKHSYTDGFAFVQSKNSTKTDDADENKLNVIILGLDNTSRMQFLRLLPKVNNYLLQNLSAVVMKGYTKVADNSLPNVLPFLTSLTYEEFTKLCAPTPKSHLDNCPFIWKKYSKMGYFTGFSDDEVSISNFEMVWDKPFLKDPTDNYFRPFALYMEDNYPFGVGRICYGTRISFDMLLDNLEDTVVVNNKTPFFHYTWTTKLSHDYPSKLSFADEPLLKTLIFLNESGHLNRTALIILGDHGMRSPEAQVTNAGKIEVRMPALYIVLPPWLRKRYPVAYANLLENSNKLTSPFDMYETLTTFMNLSRLEKSELSHQPPRISFSRKSYNLFQSIPNDRTCEEAGIRLHWCACDGARDSKAISDLHNADVRNAAAASVAAMNSFLKPKASDCVILKIQEIVSAFDIEYGIKIGPKYPNLSRQIRVYYKTEPGRGYFSSTVQKWSNGSWTVTDDPVRINHYADQSSCVGQDFKPYCYCKKLLKLKN